MLVWHLEEKCNISRTIQSKMFLTLLLKLKIIQKIISIGRKKQIEYLPKLFSEIFPHYLSIHFHTHKNSF